MLLNRANILPLMPIASSDIAIVNGSYDTADIIATILAFHKKYVTDSETIAPHFKGKNAKETSKNIFMFMMKNLIYKVDPKGGQFVKRPAQTLTDGFADCKSLSLFAASVLHQLGIPYAFRYTSYKNPKTYTHVYVIAGSRNDFTIIDRVWRRFDAEKKYVSKVDYWVNPAKPIAYEIGSTGIGTIANNPTYLSGKGLYTVSGTTETEIGKISKGSKVKTLLNAAKKSNSKVFSKPKSKSTKQAASNLFKKQAKVLSKSEIAQMAAKGRKSKAEQLKQLAKANADNAAAIAKIVNEKGQFVDSQSVLHLKFPIKSDIKIITEKKDHYDVFVAELNRTVKFPRTRKGKLVVANGLSDFPYTKYFKESNGYIALDDTKVFGTNKYAIVHRDDFSNMLTWFKKGLTPRRKQTVELEKYYKSIGNEEMAEAVVKYGPDSVGTGVLKALETGFDVVTTAASFVPGAGTAVLAVKGGIALGKAGIKAGVKTGIKAAVKKGIKTGAKKATTTLVSKGSKVKNLLAKAKALKNSKFVTKAKKINKFRGKVQENINRFMPQNTENETEPEIYQKPMMVTQNSDNENEQEPYNPDVENTQANPDEFATNEDEMAGF